MVVVVVVVVTMMVMMLLVWCDNAGNSDQTPYLLQCIQMNMNC